MHPHDFSRRDFATGLMASGLAAPALITADRALATTADNEGGLGSEAIRQITRVALIIGIQRVIVSYLLIFNPVALFGLDLRAPVPQFDENRLSTSKIPILGDFTRQPLKERFNPATLVGQVFLYNTLLMVLPQAGPVSKPSKVVIAHRNLSWEPKPKPRKMRMGKLPNLGEVKKNGLFIGGAYQTKSELLVHIKPSIVELDS